MCITILVLTAIPSSRGLRHLAIASKPTKRNTNICGNRLPRHSRTMIRSWFSKHTTRCWMRRAPGTSPLIRRMAIRLSMTMPRVSLQLFVIQAAIIRTVTWSLTHILPVALLTPWRIWISPKRAIISYSRFTAILTGRVKVMPKMKLTTWSVISNPTCWTGRLWSLENMPLLPHGLPILTITVLIVK